MQYDETRLRKMIDRAVRSEPDAEPVFYGVSGSHLYGFPSPDGDIDVRGFHVADAERYALLDQPDEQIVVNQDGITEGFEAYEEIDLVSYELRKFGVLLYQANFNVLEVVFEADRVMNGVPLEIEALQHLVESHLPMDVHRAYFGMARNNYRKYLNPDRDSYSPTAKKYLYVLRGLLGAQYVLDEETIRADIFELAKHGLGSAELIEDLVAVKLEGETATVESELAKRAEATIVDLFNELDPPETVEKADYRDAIDDWMRKVRA